MARFYKQTYLGASPHQTLCLLRYQQSLPFVPTEECYISRLPDELYIRVFEHLPPPGGLSKSSRDGKCLRYLRVSRRWRRLYETILYRNIDLPHDWRSVVRLKQLARSFEERPHLADYVRVVQLCMSKPNKMETLYMTDIVSRCRLLQDFSGLTPFSPLIWPVINVVRSLPYLQKLRILGEEERVPIQTLLKLFEMPMLAEVHFLNFGIDIGADRCGTISSQSAKSTLSYNRDADDNTQTIRDTRYHNVTTLILAGPRMQPQALKPLIQQPAHLTSISIDSLGTSDYGSQYDLETVQGLLDIHRSSLQHISLGAISSHDGQKNTIDLSKYPVLQTLQLSAQDFFCTLPSMAFAKLTPPSLRHIEVTYVGENEHDDRPSDVGIETVHWLEEFASHKASASSNKAGASTKLDSIFMDFLCSGYYQREEDSTWPWDYLIQALKYLAPHGIKLRFSKPSCSRKRWNELVECYKELRENGQRLN